MSNYICIRVGQLELNYHEYCPWLLGVPLVGVHLDGVTAKENKSEEFAKVKMSNYICIHLGRLKLNHHEYCLWLLEVPLVDS
jgi:hypothetical protein